MFGSALVFVNFERPNERYGVVPVRAEGCGLRSGDQLAEVLPCSRVMTSSLITSLVSYSPVNIFVLPYARDYFTARKALFYFLICPECRGDS